MNRTGGTSVNRCRTRRRRRLQPKIRGPNALASVVLSKTITRAAGGNGATFVRHRSPQACPDVLASNEPQQHDRQKTDNALRRSGFPQPCKPLEPEAPPRALCPAQLPCPAIGVACGHNPGEAGELNGCHAPCSCLPEPSVLGGAAHESLITLMRRNGYKGTSLSPCPNMGPILQSGRA